MLGSTFISTKKPKELVKLGDDLDALDDFVHVSLDALLTLDFVVALEGANVSWDYGDPILYDEASGIVIAQVNPTIRSTPLTSFAGHVGGQSCNA